MPQADGNAPVMYLTLPSDSFVARLDGRDAEREALLAEQGVSAVTAAVRPDLAGLGELRDVLLVERGARPDAVVLRAVFKRLADGVDAGDEFAVLEDIEDLRADAGHDLHVRYDVRGVGDLDADLRDRGADGAHGERNDVHGAAVLLQFDRIDPVVGRAGFFFRLGGDEGAGFDARDVGRIGAEQEAVRALHRVEADREAGFDHFVAEAVVLFAGTVAPVEVVGFAEGRPFFHPCDQLRRIGSGIEFFHSWIPYGFGVVRNGWLSRFGKSI